jgi:hypothetical protein
MPSKQVPCKERKQANTIDDFFYVKNTVAGRANHFLLLLYL